MDLGKSSILVITACVITAVSALTFGHSPITWLLALVSLVVSMIVYRGNPHAQALVLVVVMLVQTAAGALGEWGRPLVLMSIGLSVAASCFVALRQAPAIIGWAVLGLDLAWYVWFVCQFDDPVGVALYSILLLPFAARATAVLLELAARRVGTRDRRHRQGAVTAR